MPNKQKVRFTLFKKNRIVESDTKVVYNFYDITDRSSGDSSSITIQEGRFLAKESKCPDCGNEMLSGPWGGSCQNIKCSNTECGSKFSVIDFGDGTLSGWRLC